MSWLTGAPGPLGHQYANSLSESAADWLPSVLTEEFLRQENACDLLLVVGGDSLEGASSQLPTPKIPRIAIGSRPDPTADFSFVVPLLDPRLRATVVRSDGIFLTLCGDGQQGVVDPTVEILDSLEQRVQSKAKSSAAGGGR